MKISRFTIQACCGRTTLIFKTDQPITKDHLNNLIKLGFKEHTHLTSAGILYVDNLDLIVTGPFGSDKLQVKCKHKEEECSKKLNDFEELLHQV